MLLSLPALWAVALVALGAAALAVIVAFLAVTRRPPTPDDDHPLGRCPADERLEDVEKERAALEQTTYALAKEIHDLRYQLDQHHELTVHLERDRDRLRAFADRPWHWHARREVAGALGRLAASITEWLGREERPRWRWPRRP